MKLPQDHIIVPTTQLKLVLALNLTSIEININLPLGCSKSNSFAVMVNLVGELDHEGPVLYNGIEKAMQTTMLAHLYGKSITKPNRKMGRNSFRY